MPRVPRQEPRLGPPRSADFRTREGRLSGAPFPKSEQQVRKRSEHQERAQRANQPGRGGVLNPRGPAFRRAVSKIGATGAQAFRAPRARPACLSARARRRTFRAPAPAGAAPRSAHPWARQSRRARHWRRGETASESSVYTAVSSSATRRSRPRPRLTPRQISELNTNRRQ